MKTASQNNTHGRGQALIFRGKASLLQLKRGVKNLFDSKIKHQKFNDKLKTAPVIAESKTPLWTETAREEQFLLAGKVHNLRLVVKKAEALKNTDKIITPHTEIAALFGEKAELLDWQMPQAKEIKRTKNEKFTIAFPASTVGRKGCYELREAIRGLDIKIIMLGALIESEDFWRGFDVKNGGNNWLEVADLVVLPAFVEHKPRRILQAVSNKIPAIVSDACGLKNVKDVVTCETGDVQNLRKLIKNQIDK